MFNVMGQRAAQLTTRETGFYVDPTKYNTYYTVNNTYPNPVLMPGFQGDCFTPSGIAMVGFSAMIYPLTNQGTYCWLYVDGNMAFPHITYRNGAGWTQIACYTAIVTDLDRYRKHHFEVRGMTSNGQAYIYHGTTYTSAFWGMDFPARVYWGPNSVNGPV